MATGRTYSGREWSVILGIADNSNANGQIGDLTQDANAVSDTKVLFRVDTPINDIAWDAAYSRSEIERAGVRAIRAEDVANHYGSGVWTWDFSYVADNEQACHDLLVLIYPQGGALSAGTLTIPANPAVEDYSMSSSTETTDCTAFIILNNPLAAEDRKMHSAILQNLTIAMDIGTNGGRPTMSGQFMTGYKPVFGSNTVGADSNGSDSDYTKGIFDCTTATIEASTVSVKSFDITIDNPASRVGFQGSSGETDGYVRGTRFNVSGNISFKADSVAQEFLTSHWNANDTLAIVLGDGSTINFSIPAAAITSFTNDMADDGSFITCSWVATSGPSGANALATIIMS